MTINIVLYEPQIPPNTGSIARTCAAVGARLHLVRPLGFSLDDRYLKRAGLDYWSLVDVVVHDDWSALHKTFDSGDVPAFVETTGTRPYSEIVFPEEDTSRWIVFGPETGEIPPRLLAAYPDRNYRIPMRADARSLNLSNAVSVVVFDVLRRAGFPGLERERGVS